MRIKFNEWVLPILGVVMLFSWGAVYHVDSVNALKSEVAEVNETLNDAEINHSAQIKSKTEELDDLEKSHRQATDELDELNVQLEEKDDAIKNKDQQVDDKIKEIQQQEKRIEQLKKDLQAKKEEEARLAVVEKSKKVAKQPNKQPANKSQVLSKNTSSKTEQSAPKSKKASAPTPTTKKPSVGGTTLGTFAVTYYSAFDGAQIGITAGGTNMAGGNIHTKDGYRIIAVDRNVIPMGTIVQVTTSHGETFMAKADDVGGAIKGNKIDIAVSNPKTAMKLGRGTATLKIVK